MGPFPIPKIIDTMQTLNKFKLATALDLSQGFYTIPLDEESQKICTTVFPWGKYAYLRMVMGIACAPDMFQSIMNEILGDLPYVLIYIDDVLCLQEESESAEEHLEKLETILGRLEKAGFRANLRKSFFMQKEVEYLGYVENIARRPKDTNSLIHKSVTAYRANSKYHSLTS